MNQKPCVRSLNNVSKCGEFYTIDEEFDMITYYIYWIDTDFSINFKSFDNDAIRKITFDQPIIAFISDEGETYYILTADSKLYIAGTIDAIFQTYIKNHPNLPQTRLPELPWDAVASAVLLQENLISFDVVHNNLICIVYPN